MSMARRAAATGAGGVSMRGYSLVALLLCSSLLLVQVDPVKSSDAWSLKQLAQDFCNKVADKTGVGCTCADTVIIPGQGNDLCGYSSALGPGLNVQTTSFTGFSNQAPSPSTSVLLSEKCDARNSKTNSLSCSTTGGQSISSSVTVTDTVSLGLTVDAKFDLPGIVDASVQYSFSFSSTTSTCQGNTVTASSTCGPGGAGQPAGTCAIYKESYYSYTMQDEGFTYDAIVSGGVQMSFDSAIDAYGAIGQPSDGSKHYYWFFPIAEIVNFGQSSAGNLANVKQFDAANPSHLNAPITFHGSGYLTGQFLDESTVCSISNC